MSEYPKNLDPCAYSDFDKESLEIQTMIRDSTLHNIRRVRLGFPWSEWAGQPTFIDCVGGIHLGRYIRLEKP